MNMYMPHDAASFLLRHTLGLCNEVFILMDELPKEITPVRHREIKMELYVVAASVFGVEIPPMRQIIFWLSPYINFLLIF